MVFETRTHWLPVAAIAAMLCLAIPMWRATSNMPAGREFHRELTSYLLALNFSKGAGEARPVLDPQLEPALDPKPGLKKNLQLDCAFLFCYTGYIVLLSGTLGRRRLIPWVTALAVPAGIADGLENWASLRVIATYPSFAGVAIWPFPFATAKWGLLGAALVLLAFQLGGSILRPLDRSLTGLLAILSFLAGVCGLLSVGTWEGLLDYGHSALTVVLFSFLVSVYLVAAVVRRHVPEQHAVPAAQGDVQRVE